MVTPMYPDETVQEGPEGHTYQPPLERDGVDAEVSDQAEVMVHVLQAAQHLRAQEEQRLVSSTRALPPQESPQGKPGSFSRPVPRGSPPWPGSPESEAC